MEVLPLFPLPVVLFPGAPMPLHIFEPRYRAMVARCLEYDMRFGLIHHDADEQGPFLLEEGRVGTVALIEKHQPIPDGRSLILVRGRERFRIVRGLDQRELFYEAEIRPYTDLTLPREDGIRRAREQTLTLFHAVVQRLDEPPEEIPAFNLACDLSFQLAPYIQIDGRWQQSFLELREEAHRLERLDAVFQAAVDRS
ncbi:MAG TPA: LON peptidase substrate-binding domain-containing protein [Longimicrobiales bacterium]|nr:LON peptidase substrate-binding domain-containing protein [Longimicrobiales bacterium]